MTELSLYGKDLITLEQDTISQYGPTCVKLDLTKNKFKDLSFLSHFKSLKTLILDGNNLKSLKTVPALPSVQSLCMNNNNFADQRQLLDQIVRLFPNLTYLSLLRNPCIPDMYFAEDEGEAYQRFRWYAIHRLPTLAMLDASPIDEEEKNKAQRLGHLMVAARPEGENDQSDDDNESNAPPPQAKQYSIKDVIKNASEPKASTFLVRSKPRYDGSSSEGNRFITNDDL